LGVNGIGYTIAGIYTIPEHLGVHFDGREIYVTNVLARERMPYVEHPAEEALAEELNIRQLVVVHGPKGEGKSVLTRVVLARRILRDRAVVVEAGADVAKLKQVIDEIRGAGREPVLYFDPSQPGHYPQRPWEGERYMPTALDGLRALTAIRMAVYDKDVVAVAVLSYDQHQIAAEEGILGGHAEVKAAGDDFFLQSLAGSYSSRGCSNAAAEMAESWFEARVDNGATVAALAGDWLKRQGCRHEAAAAEAFRRAADKALDFALDYIWYAVLGGSRRAANAYAPLLVLKGLYGSISMELMEKVAAILGTSLDEAGDNMAARWLAMRHGGTLEEAMKVAAKQALERKRFEPEELYNAMLRGAADLRKRNIFDMFNGQRR
jgi:hypothetical protein